MNVILLIGMLIIYSEVTKADHDVFVPGHVENDGAYVRPHIKKSPDGTKENNYGPSQSSSELIQPKSRDHDKDGVPNYQDRDDDNDGVPDNADKKQFSK